VHPGYHLDPSEHIIRVVHRHWFDLMPVLVSSFFLVASLPVIAISYARASKDVPISVDFVGLIMVVILILAVSILMLGIFVYRQNYLVLTNMHLIQVEQIGIFNRRVSQLSLARLQDVSGKRVGIMATLFDFGNMEVQSAGEHEKFIFRNAPSPNELADDCLQAHENFLKEFGVDHN
jgi:uncharacterized membrane protein YdbT with pleckstrin-like domain